MKNRTIIVVGTIILIAVIIFAIWFHSLSIIDRLNLFERADIEKTDEVFRFSYIHNGKEIYSTGNVSWNWLVSNQYVVNGELNEDEQFHKRRVRNLDLPTWGYYDWLLEVYY